ncbi:MAG: TonB-dependent receptor [bacterium]
MTTLFLTLCGSVAFAGRSSDVVDLDLESLLDNVVVSASKHEETLAESPANVFIISRQMIENYGCLSIADALSLAPGIHVTNDYMLTQIGVRGAAFLGDWNSHVMVLIDGRPTTEQYAGSNSIDVVGVGIDNVERIEVVKGPASSLYGSNAFFGIVNLITVSPDHESAGFVSRYSTDTKLFENSARLFNRFTSGLSLYLSGSWTNRQGNKLYFEEFSELTDASLSLDEDGYNQYYLDSSDFNGGYADKKNGMENYAFQGRADFGPWSLSAIVGDQLTHLPHSFYGAVFARPENLFKERHGFVDLGFQEDLSDRLNLAARLSYNYYRFHDDILYAYNAEAEDPAYLPGPIWKDVEFDRSFSGEAKFRYKQSSQHEMVFGAEIQRHEIEQASGETDASGDRIVENVIPPEYATSSGWIYNLYLQDEYRFSPRIKAVGGLHYDYYDYTTGMLTPKIALVLAPYESSTYKFIASRGFRSPNFYELAFDDSYYYMANPDLEPEVITSFEIVSSHTFPFGVSLDVAANHSEIRDMIVQTAIDESDPNHPGEGYAEEVLQFQNVGEVRMNSVELSIQKHPIYRLSGFANLTYQSLKILDEEQAGESFNSPRWLAKIGATYQIVPQRVSLAARADYVSSSKTWDGSSVAGRTIVDVTGNLKRLIGPLNLSLGVGNLFDQDYRVPIAYDYAPSSSIQGAGRALFLRVDTEVDW